MKILVALNHPAHYYLFKYIILGFRSDGYEVKLVIRQKDILEEILISEKQNYIKICEKRKRNKNPFSVVINGILELIIQNINLYKFVKRYRPDYLLGTDVAIAYIGKLRNIPSFVFNEDDYEINKLFCKATYPFIDYIIAPEITSVGKYTDKKISYNFILII